MQSRRLLRAVAGAAAGAAAWFTFGVLAIDERATRQSFGLLPPLWTLGALIVSGAGLAVRFSRPSTLTLGATTLLIAPWLVPPTTPLMIWAGPLALLVWALVAADAWRLRWRSTLAASNVSPACAAAAVAIAIALVGDARRVTGDDALSDRRVEPCP